MIEVECADGEIRDATVCDTPMYDENREIPRGQRVDIPEIPGALAPRGGRSARGVGRQPSPGAIPPAMCSPESITSS